MIKAFPEYRTRLKEKGINLVVKHDRKVVCIFNVELYKLVEQNAKISGKAQSEK